jgi:cytochrome b subunit of formate dehydrogenase
VSRTPVVHRYGRLARWFHAGVYTLVLVLLGTGWWFVVDRYQHSWAGSADLFLHEYAGLALAGLAVVFVSVRWRGAWLFVRESVRRERGDAHWLASWPRAVMTGRFPHHEGHFDPGQRLANLVMLATLAAVVLSGLAMLYLPALLAVGPVTAVDVHRWATFALTPVVAGHIVVAAGLLPGYRGVWRSMHLGGRLPRDVARRLWPGWLARYDDKAEGGRGVTVAGRTPGRAGPA